MATFEDIFLPTLGRQPQPSAGGGAIDVSRLPGFDPTSGPYDGATVPYRGREAVMPEFSNPSAQTAQINSMQAPRPATRPGVMARMFPMTFGGAALPDEAVSAPTPGGAPRATPISDFFRERFGQEARRETPIADAFREFFGGSTTSAAATPAQTPARPSPMSPSWTSGVAPENLPKFTLGNAAPAVTQAASASPQPFGRIIRGSTTGPTTVTEYDRFGKEIPSPAAQLATEKARAEVENVRSQAFQRRGQGVESLREPLSDRLGTLLETLTEQQYKADIGAATTPQQRQAAQRKRMETLQSIYAPTAQQQGALAELLRRAKTVD